MSIEHSESNYRYLMRPEKVVELAILNAKNTHELAKKSGVPYHALKRFEESGSTGALKIEHLKSLRDHTGTDGDYRLVRFLQRDHGVEGEISSDGFAHLDDILRSETVNIRGHNFFKSSTREGYWFRVNKEFDIVIFVFCTDETLKEWSK